MKISTKLVENAIKSSEKSKALGPNNIALIHLHFIGKQAIKYLSKLISLSLRNATKPENWQMGRVLLLAKLSKDSEQANYRPIALLFPVTKFRAFSFSRIQFICKFLGTRV